MQRPGRFQLSPVFLLFLLLPIGSSSPVTAALPQTPADYQGPFYPVVRQADEDNDLIRVAGREETARGDILHLSGKVVDQQGRPVDNAVVEIWQTDPQGHYKDERDTSPGRRDPDFQYWGKAVAGEDGSYSFTTLVPGAYPPRPAHIHFKVWVDGRVRLTSQMYICKPEQTAEECLPDINRLQRLELEKKAPGEYTGSFRIVL